MFLCASSYNWVIFFFQEDFVSPLFLFPLPSMLSTTQLYHTRNSHDIDTKIFYREIRNIAKYLHTHFPDFIGIFPKWSWTKWYMTQESDIDVDILFSSLDDDSRGKVEKFIFSQWPTYLPSVSPSYLCWRNSWI